MACLWAVAQTGWENAEGGICGLGSPPTQASKRLVAICLKKADAETALDRLRIEAVNALPEFWVAGNAKGILLEQYEIVKYDPTDYWPDQKVAGTGWGGSMSRQECHRVNMERLKARSQAHNTVGETY
jgi:hypothetical protein